ncbi:hypothetical protein [Corynebacterium crudilactis]|nr:hypothetical protein [Corynebacterium crudilactis]
MMARTGTRVGTPISPGDATVRAPETVPVLLKKSGGTRATV